MATRRAHENCATMNPIPVSPGGAVALELLESPREFDGRLVPVAADQVRLSLDLAHTRRVALTVVEMDNPSTTTFAMFL
jgi:hypothetical protein